MAVKSVRQLDCGGLHLCITHAHTSIENFRKETAHARFPENAKIISGVSFIRNIILRRLAADLFSGRISRIIRAILISVTRRRRRAARLRRADVARASPYLSRTKQKRSGRICSDIGSRDE